MYHTLDEPVEVIAVFEPGTLKPARFRWKGKIYKVARVTGHWKSQQGEYTVRHFALVDTEDNVFQLTYDERRTDWVISKIWVE
ncbi:MAG: DUF6504 family protein [Candidatus Zixiibacteriota bacterium]